MNESHATFKPRMLSIAQTAKTGILSEYTLRLYAKQKKLPGVYTGRKFLVNYDALCEMLNRAGAEERA